MNTLYLVATWWAALEDKTPTKEEVKAGWPAFWIFVGLAVAVALLGFSLVRHLRKAGVNAEVGMFGPEDVPAPKQAGPSDPA